MPRLYVVAGANGSGKSTLLYRLSLRYEIFDSILYVNPDEIARKLFGDYIRGSDAEDQKRMGEAGRVTLRYRNELLTKRKDFALETTLSGKGEIRFIQKAVDAGYHVTGIYVCLGNPKFNVMRVRERVIAGGHAVEDATILRRYGRSFENARSLAGLSRHFFCIDNSADHFRLLMMRRDGKSVVRKGVDGTTPASIRSLIDDLR